MVSGAGDRDTTGTGGAPVGAAAVASAAATPHRGRAGRRADGTAAASSAS